MPTYVFKATEADRSCDRCRDGFEILMGMSEAPPAACPICASPVRRVITATSINLKQGVGDRISDKKIEQLGFTKLVKDDDGKYKKAAGKDIPGISSF